MNGGQDLGGVQGFGPVKPEADEPPFHAPWEGRVLAMTLAMGASRQWNIDRSRFARESVAPNQYLCSSYYQIWFDGLKKLMIDAGLVTEAEIEQSKPLAKSLDVPVLTKEKVALALRMGGPAERDPQGPAAFKVGDRICTLQMNPPTHTRLPRYLRGRTGVISEVHGAHVFPDSAATTGEENPQWLYSVKFEAAELWGEDTTADAVFADCFEPYLRLVK